MANYNKRNTTWADYLTLVFALVCICTPALLIIKMGTN